MRTRHTSTLAVLRSRALLQAERAPLSRGVRPLATTTAQQFPRAARTSVRNASSTPTPAPSAPPVDLPEAVELIEDPEAEGGDPTPPTPSFPAIVTTLTAPVPPTDPLPAEHHLLFNHLATSFLPTNQPCVSPPPSDQSGPSSLGMGMGMRAGRSGSSRTGDKAQVEEPVVALVCPFEGGDAYISQAVNQVAAHLSADVVRIDLALAVGFDGANAPLAETGLQAPPLSQSMNPLFHSPAMVDQQPPPHEEGAEEEEDSDGMPAAIRIPMFTTNVAGGIAGMPGPGGMFAMHNPPSRRSDDNEEWVSFFTGLLNMELPAGEAGSAQKRIVLLESTAAMAETFDAWWPALLEAVRRRRRGPSKGKGKKASTVTTSPTTIVLSAPPSLLLPHTAQAAEPGPEGSPTVDVNKEHIRSVVEALSAGGSSVHVEGGDKGEEKLWWSSEEHDYLGRQQREERRLRAMLSAGPTALLPFSSQSNQPVNTSAHPILDMLMNRKKPKEDGADASLAWKTLPIIPSTRDTALEQHERVRRRRAINAALMMRAVGQLGATLKEPTLMLEAPGSLPPRGRVRRLNRRKEPDSEWSEYVIGWKDAEDLASTAVGRASVTGDIKKLDGLTLTWNDIQLARAVTFDHERQVDETVHQYLAASDIASAHRERRAAPEQPTVADPVVEGVKKAKDLSKHEKRLLGCIVDPSKLATSSFKDVHLPFKTIDAIRSVISLPLLFPEAFQGGILKDHVTSGALLFGPPGTGKTLLARAIAAESGARMLAIQPSDVNDMWVGEGEKLVKAVFNLARRLSPCVVFIDEVDSLFGARSARDSGGGSKAHNQILTEFMQEMDGLSSANANREKRIVVMGATNRPFDLDDAVLRRLPRRLLVDLPTAEDRKAILEILLRNEETAPDVNLEKLAAETEGFSGSDLKHLCVAAALAAVKDIVKVPWKAGEGVVPTPVPGPPPSRPSGGHREAVAVEVPEEPEAAKQVLTPAAQLVESTYLQQLEARAQSESDEAAAAAGKVESQPSEDAVEKETADEVGSSDAETTPVETAQETPSIPKRILTAKHFDTALGEIRPSSSEEGTLPELRKWAELYGEGGKEKGKKSGFGKGFGFGLEPLSKRKGFGRVSEDKQ